MAGPATGGARHRLAVRPVPLVYCFRRYNGCGLRRADLGRRCPMEQFKSATASVTFEVISHGRALEVHVSGRLSRADYDRLLPRLEALLRESGRLSFLIILRDFHGWEPAAAWADAKFDFRHRHQFGRIAVVGDAGWEEWGTRLSASVLPWEVRFFSPEREAAARQWVQEKEENPTV